MSHLGGAHVSNPTRLYHEPVFGCSSQAMHEHVLAFSSANLKPSPNQCTWTCSADPMYTFLLLLTRYCDEPLISKATILRPHVNLNRSFINSQPQILHSPGNSSCCQLCEPVANVSPGRTSYTKPLPGDFKTLSRREEKEETALTKMSQKERRPLRSPFGNYKFGLPNKRSRFSEWNLYYHWLIWTTYTTYTSDTDYFFKLSTTLQGMTSTPRTTYSVQAEQSLQAQLLSLLQQLHEATSGWMEGHPCCWWEKQIMVFTATSVVRKAFGFDNGIFQIRNHAVNTNWQPYCSKRTKTLTAAPLSFLQKTCMCTHFWSLAASCLLINVRLEHQSGSFHQ